MKFQLFNRVALREDLPQYNLRRGDVATGKDGHSKYLCRGKAFRHKISANNR